jgi:hypothetical protein
MDKRDLQTTSTDAGTAIRFKPLNTKANASIRRNFVFDFNVTDTTDLPEAMQDLLSISILE